MKINVTVEGPDGNDLRQALRETITQAVQEQYEPIFERVRVNNHGRPIDVVKEALRRELAGTDLTFTEAELSEYAEALAAGEPVTITVNLPDGFSGELLDHPSRLDDRACPSPSLR